MRCSGNVHFACVIKLNLDDFKDLVTSRFGTEEPSVVNPYGRIGTADSELMEGDWIDGERSDSPLARNENVLFASRLRATRLRA